MAEPIDVGELVRLGVAVIAATADAALRPQMSRAWGATLSDDGATLSVCVDAQPSSAMALTLRTEERIAVRFARIASQASVQLKGRIAAVGAPTPERLRTVAEHVERWVAETATVGVPESTARAMAGSDLIDVTITVDERFDETPGPGAGRRL